MLNSIMGSNEKVAFYIRYAKEEGIEVLPPDINESSSRFTVSRTKVRFGMAAIKNVGVNVIESIVKSRKEKGNFKDFMDFINKIDTAVVGKRAVESLIKAGAFDSFIIHRSRLLAVFEKILDGTSSQRKKNIEGQINLFGALEEDNNLGFKIDFPNIKEFEKKHILAMEKEMTGLYLSGHPLEEFVEALNFSTNTNTSELLGNQLLEGEEAIEGSEYLKDGDIVIVGGIITAITKKMTKSNAMMAFLRLEDLYGAVEVVVFPKTFQKNINNIHEDSIVAIRGRVSIREDEAPKLICEEIKPLVKGGDDKLYIRVNSEEEGKAVAKFLKFLPIQNKGSMPVYFFITEKKQTFVSNQDLWISNDAETISKLVLKFGEINVKIK